MPKSRKHIILIVLLIAFSGLMYGATPWMAKHAEPYPVALSFIEHDPAVLEKTGEIEKISIGFTGFSIEYRGPDGTAKYAFLLKGKKGNGTVYLQLKKELGVWTVTKSNFIEEK